MNRAEYKKQLIAQGALYRAELLLAQQHTQDNLAPDKLAKGAFHYLAASAMSALRGGGLSVLLQSALPLAVGSLSSLAKSRPGMKRFAFGAALVGAIASAVVFAKKKKATEGEATADADADSLAG